MPETKPLSPSNSKLRKSCKTITRKELRSKEIQTIIEELISFVYANNARPKPNARKKPRVVGLAANQLGYDLSIAVVDLAIGHKDFSDVHVLVNPSIKWVSKTTLVKDEGCVNLPDVRGLVKRSRRVKVDAYDRSGNRLSLDVSGWPAVLLQHEVGHLNGELFIDYLEDPTRAHLVKPKDFADYKNNRKEWAKFIDVSGLIGQKKIKN